MFCLKCGKEIDNDAMSCPFCDCPTENAGTINTNTFDDANISSADNFGIIGIVFGIIGIIFAWLIAIIGLICSIVGIVFSIIGRNKYNSSQKCRIGIILSVIALIFSILNYVVTFLFLV